MVIRWGIAERYNLEVESILYANFNILQDKSDNLKRGGLTIPPTDGILHKWIGRDTIESVASKYGARSRIFCSLLAANLDLSNPDIKPGTVVMVPGGNRMLTEVSYAAVVVDDEGNMRSGFSGRRRVEIVAMVWLVLVISSGLQLFISFQETITDLVTAQIDIGAGVGSQIFADSGVVVYAGWLDGGYGNFVVIDHGNGFRPFMNILIKSMCAVATTCFRAMIGLAGSTGNSTGPHLHFEIRYGGTQVNPWDYLP